MKFAEKAWFTKVCISKTDNMIVLGRLWWSEGCTSTVQLTGALLTTPPYPPNTTARVTIPHRCWSRSIPSAGISTPWCCCTGRHNWHTAAQYCVELHLQKKNIYIKWLNITVLCYLQLLQPTKRKNIFWLDIVYDKY